MAEILVTLRPSARPGGYQPGDVVIVWPDGHPWGVEERNTDKFAILRAPGLSPAELEAQVRSRYGVGLCDAPQTEATPRPRRRALRVRVGARSGQHVEDLLGLVEPT